MQTDIKYTHKQADSDTGSTFVQCFEESLGINTCGRSSVAHEGCSCFHCLHGHRFVFEAILEQKDIE